LVLLAEVPQKQPIVAHGGPPLKRWTSAMGWKLWSRACT